MPSYKLIVNNAKVILKTMANYVINLTGIKDNLTGTGNVTNGKIDWTLQLGYKDNAWFTANASLVLLEGQIVYLEQTGTYKIGDGVTVLSALSFLGGGGGGTQTLQDVINESAEVAGTLAQSTDGFTTISVDDNLLNLSSTDGTANTNITDITPTDFTTIIEDGNSQGLKTINATEILNQITEGVEVTSTDLFKDSFTILSDDGGANSTEVKVTPTIFTYNTVKVATVNDIIPVNTSTIGTAINGAASATPNDTDLVMSVESSVAKKNTWTQIKTFLKNYFDGIYTTTSAVASQITAALNARITGAIYAYQNTDSSTTGSTLQTVLANIAIIGGDMGDNGVLIFDSFVSKIGTAGSITWEMYFSTVGTNTVGNTGTPTGSTLFATYTNTSANLTGGRWLRKIVNKNSQASQAIYPAANGAINDSATSTTARTSRTFDTSANFWIVVTGTLANSADTARLDNVQIYINK
jgi:hypothetical protein